jgi:hypothetical protein
VNTGRGLEAAGYVALGVGIVGVVAGAAMYLVSGRRESSRVVRLGFNGNSVLLSGEF